MEILPHETEIMDTGLRFAIPKGYFGLIKDKSGLAAAELRVSGGVIDQKYTGRIKVILTNYSKIQKFRILAGERAAQILFLPYHQGRLREVQEIHQESTRGTQGFGSTGLHAISRKKITAFEDRRKEESKFSYKLGSDLTKTQQQVIHELFRENEDVLTTSFKNIRGDTPFKHHIDTGATKPIKQ